MRKTNREPLLSLTKKDFRVDTFKSGGKGGQHQNKTNSGVRITHIATGISYECREEREQSRNKKKAFKKLCADKKFLLWIKQESFKKENEERDKEKYSITEENIIVEHRGNGKWEKEKQ